MALQGVVEQGLESAYLPALAQLGLKGMVCLPVSKQLDPVLGIDCHVMVPGGPLPNPYIGLLINPRTVMSEKVCKILLRPSPPAWGTPSRRGICDVDSYLSFYLIFHSRKYGSRLAHVPSVFSLATESKR